MALRLDIDNWRWAGDDSPIPLYQAATCGPPEAEQLIARDGRRRR